MEKELVNQRIQPQYGSGRQRVDIVVHSKVPIEIKKDLKSTAALQRTIGQLDGYLKVWQGIILVLCGNISGDLFKDLKKYGESRDELLSKRVYLFKR